MIMILMMIILQTWPFSSASASFHLQLPLSSVLNSEVALLNVSPGKINLVMMLMLVHMTLVIDHMVIDDYNGSTKKMVFFRNNSKPGPPPPLVTFRDKNVTFGRKSRVFKAKNNDHQNFT